MFLGPTAVGKDIEQWNWGQDLWFAKTLYRD
jgi:hypothetical protein